MGAQKVEPPRYPAIGNARVIAGVFVFAALLGGCASLVPQTAVLREGLPQGLPAQAEIAEVPFFPQAEYQCGPAALATVLAHFKVKVTPDDLVAEVYLPERKGSLQVEMLAAARRHGVVSYLLAPSLEDVMREVAGGNPVIVLQDQGIGPFENWHYAVVVGYDYQSGELILRSGEQKRRMLHFAFHEYMWSKGGYWAMLAVPPDRIPATATEAGWLAAIAAFERVDARGAQSAYANFLKRWPANVNAALALANTHYALSELKEAEAVLRLAAGRQPDSVIVLNNLAQTLSDQGRHAEALALVERAVAAGGPFEPAARETRAMILGRMAKMR